MSLQKDHQQDISTNYFFLDTFTLDEQVTWILPAIRNVKTAPKSSLLATEAGSSYISLARGLIKDSGIYALSSLASPFISLVLTPFLTRNLSHADYGALAVLTTLLALVAGITQLGLNAAFFRVYDYDYESERDRLDVLSTVVALLLLVSLPTVVVLEIAAPWLSSLVLGSTSFSDAIRLAGVAILMQNLSVPGFSWLRAKRRADLYSLLAIASLLVNAGVTIVLVGVAHMGIVGSLIAVVCSYAIVVICTLPGMLIRAGIRLHRSIAWGLLTFGVPHLANLVSGWVLQLSDRYLLGHLASLSEAASYAVAYSLGGILSVMIIAPFSLAWWSMMYSIAKRTDAKRVFVLVFRWFSLVLLFSTFGCSLAGIIVLDIFFPPAYHTTAPVIPIIALSTMFYGAYSVVTVGISLERKTWIAAILTTVSALLNVGINIVFIPLHGAMGAAVATLIAYIVLTLSGYVVNQRLYPVPFQVGQFLIALLVGLFLYAGCNVLAQSQTLYVGWGIRFAALVLYGGFLAVFALLPKVRKIDTSNYRRILNFEKFTTR
jgi:O-antigen/teichoic acid export membrane protein